LKSKLALASAIVSSILLADILTKRWAVAALDHGVSIDALGGLVPLTLAFNTGIAFGLDIPALGRWVLVVLSLVVVFMLANLLVNARPGDRLRVVSVSLVTAGALGNLVDRIRWDRGVVDFIGPIDLGFMHWPIFNVADMAITVGAILLGLSLWREESQPEAAAAPAGARPNPAREDS
jgi:signal peptidase II